jgi:uncharacterized protein (TIGR02246 family)
MATSNAEVQAVIDRYVAAVKAMDSEAMISNYADNVHVFDSMSAWEFDGVDAWKAAVEEWLRNPSSEQECEFDDVAIMADGDLASVRAAVRFQGTHNGEVNSMWNRLTWTLRRIDGDWKIVTEHSSVPINDETMEPIWERPA